MRTNQHGPSRVSHDVQRALSKIISELKDPRIALMTSVTRCEVTRDLKECKCYISVLGDDEATMKGLENAKGYIPKVWEGIRQMVVLKGLLEKFTQNEDLKRKLLATENECLIEGNTWGDRFWGKVNGVGENHLGQILMKIRDELRD